MKKSIVLFLLMLGSLLFSQDKNVFDIARSGTVQEMETLVKQNPDIINSVNQMGFSPLILACYRGNGEVAKYLIKKVKNLDYMSQEGTALAASVYRGDLELTKKLLENKADPNIQDSNGIIPLIFAIQNQNKAMVELLLEYRSNRTLSDKKGKTVFEYAFSTENQDIINLIKN